MDEVVEIYSIDDDEFYDVWDKWVKLEFIKYDNHVTDLMFEIYSRTGVKVDLKNGRFIDLINMESGSAFKLVRSIKVDGEYVVNLLKESTKYIG